MLGSEHRMNTPGTATGNWEFRYRSGLLDEGMAKGLKQMTDLFGRWGYITYLNKGVIL